MSFPEYSAYKESGVEWFGDVPAHWPVHRLKWVATVLPSNVDKQTVEGEQAVLLCNYLDVYRNDRIVGTLDFMRASASPEQIEKLSLRVDDCIITKDSEDPSDIGVPAYVGESISNLICGYHLSIVRPNAHRLTGRFLFYTLKADYVRATFQVGSNGLTRYGLGRYAIDNLDLAVPPLSEQSAIADFLDRETAKIDGLIAEQERLIALLKEKRQAVISRAVTKGLDPNAPMKDSGVDWLGEVPAHWEVGRVKNVASLISKGTTPSTVGFDFVDDGIRFLKAENIVDSSVSSGPEFYISLEAHDALLRSQLNPADVLVVIAGATTGKSAVMPRELLPANTNQAVAFVRCRSASDAGFVQLWLSSDLIQKAIRLSSVQSAQPNLSMEDLGNLLLLLPPQPERPQICDAVGQRLDKLQALVSQSQRAISLLHERRSALISAAVTGKIDIRNLVPAAAEAA